jgi:hypothetical protein
MENDCFPRTLKFKMNKADANASHEGSGGGSTPTSHGLDC